MQRACEPWDGDTPILVGGDEGPCCDLWADDGRDRAESVAVASDDAYVPAK